jgi:peptidoglycan/xylan/chitin deacetylase (PgdA/CDA1 family)
VTRGSRARAVLAALALGAVAWTLLSTARWVSRRGVPDPASDLDVPRLFAKTELRWEELARTPPTGVPILSYHYFREGLTATRVLRVLGAVLLSMPLLPDKDYWTTPLPEFERQMRWLHESGYRAITLDELSAWMEGRAERPERAVVITIDDGDESLVRFAVPVLRRYGLHATLFLLTGRVGEKGWNDVDFTDWATLRALEREGVLRVESHTHDMHTKRRLQGEAVPVFLLAARDAQGRISGESPLARDLLESRAAIRRELGHDCRYLAWPFGFGTAEVDSLAHALGYRRILTLSPKRNLRDFRTAEEGHPSDALGRYSITARTSFRIFRLMVEGGRPTA